MEQLFTSESVSEGHPDKVADLISDGVLDAVLALDSNARVACDVLVKNDTVIVAGEITTTAQIDLDLTVRKVIRNIGYTDPELGFDADSCTILKIISEQSQDISKAVTHAKPEDQGAGDQGLVFGYACTETDVFMPAPILYAHRLMMKHAEVRKSAKVSWLLPDAKSQVTFRYVNDSPVEVTNVVLSTQHRAEVSQNDLIEFVREEIVRPVLNAEWLTKNTRYMINPSGRFVKGGPLSDCGLTGRKTAVDSYGGMGRDGGGCYSGKDPSKTDRSGAYIARYVAKSLVTAGVASRLEIQIAYAIGIAAPVGISVDSFGTGKISDLEIIALINKNFDLRPFAIIEALNLKQPIYIKTAAYGHFGRPDFSWEKTKVLK